MEDYAEYSGEIIKNNARIGYLAQELTEEQKAQSVYEFCAQSDVFYEQSPKELAAIAGQLGLSSDIFYADQRMGSFPVGEGQAAACKASDGTAGCSVFRRAVQRHRH